jgi:hypothetical protein
MRLFSRRHPRMRPSERPPRAPPIDAPDVLVLAGFALAIAGVDRYSRPLAMILAGGALAALGVILASA